MKYPRILSAIRSARWAVTPSTLQAITDALGAHLRGDISAHLPARVDSAPAPQPEVQKPEAELVQRPGPAVIQIYGIIGKHLSSLETGCGGCDIDGISSALSESIADPAVTAIILDLDSPGGTVTGVPELAAKIRQLDATSGKPIYAYTSAQCCSAAYWIASACRGIYCAPSADLGSIGVYIALVDDSEWWQKQGYKLELIKAGEFKATGISGKPLTDAERALLQADVDAIYASFTSDVRAGRGDVADTTMQGQTFMGARAVALNLADGLAPSLDDMLTLLVLAEPGTHAEQG